MLSKHRGEPRYVTIIIGSNFTDNINYVMMVPPHSPIFDSGLRRTLSHVFQRALQQGYEVFAQTRHSTAAPRFNPSCLRSNLSRSNVVTCGEVASLSIDTGSKHLSVLRWFKLLITDWNHLLWLQCIEIPNALFIIFLNVSLLYIEVCFWQS
jgi:hypothetical protein